MKARLLTASPLSSLHLRGPGDRLAWAPAPGAIPAEEPLLPRLETFLGSLAAAYYEAGNQSIRGGWRCVVLEAARLLLGCVGNCVFTGPFLLVKWRDGGCSLYVNVSIGLLDVSMVGYWIDLAYKLAGALTGEFSPLRLYGKSQEAARSVAELREEGYLVPADLVSFRYTSLALDPSSKTGRYGLLYSMTDIDYVAAMGRWNVESARLIVVAFYDDFNDSSGTSMVLGLGPRRVPVRLEVAPPVDAPVALDSRVEVGVAVSPAPECMPGGHDCECKSYRQALHPGDPGSEDTVYTRSYLEPDRGWVKDPPIPALAPGTVVWDYRDPEGELGLARVLDPDTLAWLEGLARRLACPA